jgi:tetratricopeptide (TPR) repeat protein
VEQNDTIFHRFTAEKEGSLPLISPARSRAWLWLPLVLGALAAIYLPGLANLPVFDDSYFTDGALAANFSSLQLRPRMLSYGSFLWLQSLAGEGLWKQRVFNLALHAAVVVALFAFYREVLRTIVAPRHIDQDDEGPYHESAALGLAVGYFALNPVAVYAVAYLIQRSILMATLFVVTGLWLFALGLRTRRPWLHALAIACYLLAVASKEHAVLAPLAALPVYIVVAQPPGKRLAIMAVAGTALIALGATLLWDRLARILGTPFDEFSRVYLAQLAALNPEAPRHAWGLSVMNQAWLFFEYGFRWMLPVGDWMSISMRPPFPVSWATFPQVLGVAGYLGVLVAGFWLVVRHRDWRALLGLSLLLPALLFATEFVTVWVQDPFVLYRSYLWAIGIPGIVLLAVHGPAPRVVLVLGIILGLLLAWQAVERTLSLATPETAWSDAIAKLPKDARAVGRWFPYLNRGSYYAERDQYELAMRDFDASAGLGDMGMGAFNTGSMLNATGKPQQALAQFDRAEKQGYDLYSLPFQRGLALAALGKPAEAYHQFDVARVMYPPSPVKEILWLQLGRTALQSGQREEAIKDLELFVAYDPKHSEARYLLALAYVSKGEHERALKTLEPAGEGGPAHYARALAYHGLKRKREAAAEIDAAIRAGPDNAMLREWQAKIRAMP